MSNNLSIPTRNDFQENLIVQFIQRRKALKLTQADVDYRMGNSDRQISKWECGMRTPTSFNLLCWAESLECNLSLESK